MCFTPCTTTSGQLPFSLSVPYTAAVIAADGTITPGVATAGASQIFSGNCNNDFLAILGGFSSVASLTNNNILDRFCGERFTTALGATVSSTVCSKWLVANQRIFWLINGRTQNKKDLIYSVATASPFRMLYRTNGDETITPTADVAGFGNRGFCLSYQQGLIWSTVSSGSSLS